MGMDGSNLYPIPIWRKFVFDASVPNTIIKPERKPRGIIDAVFKFVDLQPDLKYSPSISLTKYLITTL